VITAAVSLFMREYPKSPLIVAMTGLGMATNDVIMIENTNTMTMALILMIITY
jgi:hypothetical protein